MSLSGVFLKQWEVIHFVAFRLCSCLSSVLILISKCCALQGHYCFNCSFSTLSPVEFVSVWFLFWFYRVFGAYFPSYAFLFYFPFFKMWIRSHSTFWFGFLPLFIHAGCHPISAEYLNHISPLKSNMKVILWFRQQELLTVWVAFCCSISTHKKYHSLGRESRLSRITNLIKGGQLLTSSPCLSFREWYIYTLGKAASQLPGGEDFALKSNSSWVLGMQNSEILRL